MAVPFEKVVNQLINAGVINKEDKELYTYGLEQGLLIVINILTTMLIGIVLGMVWQSILFMIAYLPLRSFAGGYHAKTQSQCYFLSIVLTSAVLLAIRFISWTNLICLSVALAAGIIIFVLAPVAARNKPLDRIEVSVYKKRTRIILMAEICILLSMFGLGFNQILPCISVSLLALSVMLILGSIPNRIRLS